MSIATLLIDATVDAVRETDRQLLDAMKRSVPVFDVAAMQQWYDQRDYDAMRRSLMAQVPASLRPTFKPLPTDIYYPTSFNGTYKATGTITINKDRAQGLLKAVETPMLKVGDRVKILRPFTEEEKRKPPHWTPGMSALVGAEGVVDYIGEFVSVRVGKGGSYSWLPETLELVPATDEIAFGPFPSKEEVIAVRMDHAHAPVWEAKSPTGELSFVRCYPNIGDVDTFASFRDTTYKKSEKFPAFADYSARPLDKDGKPFARKHLALTTGATQPSPSIKVTDVDMTTTVQVPATATAAEVVAVVKASGSQYADGLSLGGKPLTQEAMTAAVEAICTEFNRHSYSVAMPVDPRTGQVVGPLPVPGTRENPVKVTVYPAAPAKLSTDQERKIADALRQRVPSSADAGSSYAAAKVHSDVVAAKMGQREGAKPLNFADRIGIMANNLADEGGHRDFPTVEEVRANPFNIWTFRRPDGSYFKGHFVIDDRATTPHAHIYLQTCKLDGSELEGRVGDPFSALRELKACPVLKHETVIKCGTQVSLDTGFFHGVVVSTRRSKTGEPQVHVKEEGGQTVAEIPLSRLKVRVPRVTYTAASQSVKITAGQSDVAYTTAHDVAEVRGTSDRPLSEVTHNFKVGDVVCTFEDVIHGFRTPWVVTAVQGEDVSCKLFGEGEERLVTLPAKELRILLTDKGTPTTISELEQLGATMPTTEVKPTSRMRRAITEATRRAPVELGLNQAHEAIVKQAARKFKGTAAEKKVVARFLTDLLGSEYGKAGLAAALATVIPQLAPLLGKHEGKADVLAEELATRSATILAVKAGADLISLLGPLTAILSDMISSAEPPQITAGSGRSALDEISVTTAPVAATAKR